MSFPLSQTGGEIFLCAPLIEEEKAQFGRTAANFAEFLFIHGIFHLKGMEHGSKMEEEENKIRLKFNV